MPEVWRKNQAQVWSLGKGENEGGCLQTGVQMVGGQSLAGPDSYAVFHPTALSAKPGYS